MPVQHLHPDSSRLRVFVHKETKRTHAFFAYHSIGVQQKDIFSATDPDRLVIRFGKPRIILILDKSDFRKTRAKIFDRTVGRMIIDNQYFRLHPCYGSTHGTETLFEKIFYVVVNNYN